MKVNIITDNKDSAFIPFGVKLKEEFEKQNHQVSYVYDKERIKKGDVCFILSCLKLIEESYLKLNKHNIVIHASDLPSGKGFSPLQWQILEGKNEITLTLFEVIKEVDVGPYYLKSKLAFDGTELLDELREKMGAKILAMCLEYIEKIDILKPTTQKGIESYYRKRTLKDDELDIEKSIKDQFDHFRIADNRRFPLYFNYKKERYIVKIYKENR